MRKLVDRRLVLATHNKGKIGEFTALLARKGLSIATAADFGLSEPDETGSTFAENSRIKARHASQATGLPAISDDSGIVVDALNGEPGVHTADWAETPSGRDFVKAMTLVWNRLEEVKACEPRTARFRATICVAWPDGHEAFFEGSVEGRIVWPMRGNFGFGFDPVFLPDGKDQTFGEMDQAEKNRISHRAIAMRKLEALCLGR